MVKIKFLKDTETMKIGEIAQTSKKSAENYISQGFAELINECNTKKPKNSKNNETEVPQEKEEPINKKILDKWASVVVDKEAIWTNKEGVSQVNQNKIRHYEEHGFKGTEVLWVAPKDSLVFEFEDEKSRNERYITEIESASKSLGFDYVITGHGGKSDYFRMFNIKNIPLGEDNHHAKLLLFDYLMPASAKNQLDRTNLGWTLSPVIDAPHWKKKYNGAIHKILRGINPLEHKNEYPKELLKQLKKQKKVVKNKYEKVRFSDAWVEDFFNYCCENKLPAGARHIIIEKNLAVFLLNHPDRDKFKGRYYKAQDRKHDSLRTWELAILRGQYSELSAGELANFIKEYSIPFNIPKKKIEESIANKEEITPINETHQQILENPNLFNIIDAEFDKTIVHEEQARQGIFLASCTSLVENCDATSSNLVVNDDSGKGKDHVVKNVLSIFPSWKVIKRTRISPTVFTYWKPVDDWTGYICYLEDVSNNILNHDVFKVMTSGGSHATVVINQQAVDIEIKGKPFLILTSASANPNQEMIRRFPIQNLDSGINQTKEIIRRRLDYAVKGISVEYDKNIQQALGKLRRVKVKIPFASDMFDVLPHDHAIMRTNINRILDLIKSSCALHQFQRDKDNDGFLLATGQDYDIAVKVINGQTSNKHNIPLTKDQQKILGVMNEFDWADVKSLSDLITFLSEEWLRKQLQKLVQYELIKTRHTHIEGIKQKVRQYKINTIDKFKLPYFNEISCRICSIDKKDKKDTEDKKDSIDTKKHENIGTIESIESIERSNQPSDKKKYHDFLNILPNEAKTPQDVNSFKNRLFNDVDVETFNKWLEKASNDGDIIASELKLGYIKVLI